MLFGLSYLALLLEHGRLRSLDAVREKGEFPKGCCTKKYCALRKFAFDNVMR